MLLTFRRPVAQTAPGDDGATLVTYLFVKSHYMDTRASLAALSVGQVVHCGERQMNF